MCTNKHYELEGCKIHKTSSLPERKLLTKEVVALYLLVSSPVLFFLFFFVSQFRVRNKICFFMQKITLHNDLKIQRSFVEICPFLAASHLNQNLGNGRGNFFHGPNV